jgi:hypothetical protein
MRPMPLSGRAPCSPRPEPRGAGEVDGAVETRGQRERSRVVEDG